MPQDLIIDNPTYIDNKERQQTNKNSYINNISIKKIQYILTTKKTQKKDSKQILLFFIFNKKDNKYSIEIECEI